MIRKRHVECRFCGYETDDYFGNDKGYIKCPYCGQPALIGRYKRDV